MDHCERTLRTKRWTRVGMSTIWLTLSGVKDTVKVRNCVMNSTCNGREKLKTNLLLTFACYKMYRAYSELYDVQLELFD